MPEDERRKRINALFERTKARLEAEKAEKEALFAASEALRLGMSVAAYLEYKENAKKEKQERLNKFNLFKQTDPNITFEKWNSADEKAKLQRGLATANEMETKKFAR